MARAFWLLTWMLAVPLCAEPAEEKPSRGRMMRLLAVGELPPYRQVVEDGIRREVPPPPGSLPPRQVSGLTGKGDEEKDLGKGELALGRISGPITVPGGEVDVRLRDVDGREWVTAKAPQEGDFLIIVWRKPGGRDWSEVNHLVVRALPTAGQVLIVNVSPFSTALVMDGERIGLRPGQRQTKPLLPGKVRSLEIGWLQESKPWQRLASTSLEQQQGERTVLVIYRADGVAPRRPLKFTTIRELAE